MNISNDTSNKKKLQAYDIVNMGGRTDSKNRVAHKLIRKWGKHKTDDYKVPIHSGIVMPTDKGLKVVDLTMDGVRANDYKKLSKEYTIQSITRLDLNDKEKKKIHKSLQKDLKNDDVKYTVGGLFGQHMFRKKFGKANKQVCSEYVANKVSKNSKYKFNKKNIVLEPADLANPASITEKGNPWVNPDMKIIKADKIVDFKDKGVVVKDNYGIKKKYKKNFHAAVPKPAKLVSVRKD